MNTKRQHILVTGATGFIGSSLMRFLTQKPNVQPWGVSMHGGMVDNISVEKLDLTSKSAVDNWKNNAPVFDAIFHLAADMPGAFHGAQAESTLITNILMTQNALSLAEKHKTVFIYASGSSVYGGSVSAPCLENISIAPDNYYSLGKYMGELLCALEGKNRNFPALSLRISAPYGPNQKTRTVINIFLDAALQSQNLMLYGDGQRTQDFTYIDDVVHGMWQSYLSRKSGAYNIASGNSVTMRELAETVVSLTPNSASRVEFAGKDDPQNNYRGIFPVDKARRELGYSPKISLSDGLQSCLQSRLRGL